MDVWNILTSDTTLTPLGLSARVLVVSGCLHLMAGVPIAFWLSRTKGAVHTMVDAAVTLPLVFPPVASGFVLLMILGRNGPVGRLF